jgi:hypothetical protein
LRKNLHWSSAVYPTQAKKRLEWGTHPLLLVQGVGVRELSCRDYREFPLYRQQRVGAPFKPFFGLSGITRLSTTRPVPKGFC